MIINNVKSMCAVLLAAEVPGKVGQCKGLRLNPRLWKLGMCSVTSDSILWVKRMIQMRALSSALCVFDAVRQGHSRQSQFRYLRGLLWLLYSRHVNEKKTIPEFFNSADDPKSSLHTESGGAWAIFLEQDPSCFFMLQEPH